MFIYINVYIHIFIYLFVTRTGKSNKKHGETWILLCKTINSFFLVHQGCLWMFCIPSNK